MPGGTIKDCLTDLGVASAGLGACSTLREEWTFIKKAYFKKILTCHPDKGGDVAVFRSVSASFEVLRELFGASAIQSFAAEHAQSTADSYKEAKDDLRGMSTPSWEYYAEAAKDVIPTYRVELARSARSRCQARGSTRQCSETAPFIEKGGLRIGFMMEGGSYGLWVHLGCWRVPSKVWLGLPDPAKTRDFKKFEAALVRMNDVTLCGVGELAPVERKKVVRYTMDKQHWTFGGAIDKVKKKPAASAVGAKGGEAGNSKSGSSIVVAGPERKQFVIPVPGKGAPAGSLAGKSFVITGTFPEVGGGAGFKVGKERVRKMIESFGGKASSSISGRTDFLVVGKQPGASKVKKAHANRKISLVSIRDLKVGLEQGRLDAAKAKPMVIKDFARGFGPRRATKALAIKPDKKRRATAAAPAAKKRKVAARA